MRTQKKKAIGAHNSCNIRLFCRINGQQPHRCRTACNFTHTANYSTNTLARTHFFVYVCVCYACECAMLVCMGEGARVAALKLACAPRQQHSSKVISAIFHGARMQYGVCAACSMFCVLLTIECEFAVSRTNSITQPDTHAHTHTDDDDGMCWDVGMCAGNGHAIRS